MKSRTPQAAAILILLVMLACGPLTPAASTPAALLSKEEPPSITPTPSVPLPPRTEAPTPAAAEPTHWPLESWPTLAPQPPGPAHFQGGDAIHMDSIAMTSTTEGWGIIGPYVLATADGGQTWREATPPESLAPGQQNQAYGAFLDAQTAWIVFSQGGQILPEALVWQTVDSGRTWTRSSPLAHQVGGVSVWAEFAVLDAQNVWLMVRSVFVGTCTQHAHELFHTGDGGLTWTSLDGQISDDYTGMVFRDALNGLRTLQTTGCGYGAAPPAYDVTTDGGANWESRELPPPREAPDLFSQYIDCETYQPDVFSTKFIRMLMGCEDVHNPPTKFTSYLYASYDGGNSWDTQLLPDKVRASQDTLIFFGAYPTLLLGRDMYKNTNGGFGDWSSVKTVNWDGRFSFVDPQTGWAVARSGPELALVKTIDGGSTWNVIKPRIAE